MYCLPAIVVELIDQWEVIITSIQAQFVKHVENMSRDKKTPYIYIYHWILSKLYIYWNILTVCEATLADEEVCSGAQMNATPSATPSTEHKPLKDSTENYQYTSNVGFEIWQCSPYNWRNELICHTAFRYTGILRIIRDRHLPNKNICTHFTLYTHTHSHIHTHTHSHTHTVKHTHSHTHTHQSKQ